MNDSLNIDSLYLALSVQTDSTVSKLSDIQKQICLLNENHAAAQNQCYLLFGVIVVGLLLVFFLFHRLNNAIRYEVKAFTKLIEKSFAELLASKYTTNKPFVPETTPIAHKSVSEYQTVETAYTPEPVHAAQPIVSTHGLCVKYGSIQAPDSEEVLRIADRSLSDASSVSKWFAISYQDGSSTATYTINPDAMAEILQDLQTFQLFTAPFTLANSALPMHISVIHEGILQRVERGWVVKKRLVVKF